jgi:hypothetical protein
MQIKNGYIGGVHSNSFISKGIQLFLRIWVWVRYHEKKKQVDSHSMLAVCVPNRLGVSIAESIQIGVQIIDSTQSGYLNNKNVTWRVPKIPWTKEELDRMAMKALEISEKVTRYDFANFVYQIQMIFEPDHEWHGPIGKNAENRDYCSELVAYLLNSSGRKFFDKPWAVNPEDIAHHPDLIIVTE